MLLTTIAGLIKKHHQPKEDFFSYMVEKLCNRANSGMDAEEVKGYVLALSDIKSTLGKFE